MQEKRPVVSATDIVLARPHQLDGTPGPDRLGGLGKLGGEMHICLPAPAEASAGQHGLDLDALERQAEHRSDRVVIAGLQLAPKAGPRPFPIPVQKSVKRLHRRVGEIRKDELCLDDLSGFREHGLDVAADRRRHSGPAGKRPVFLDHLLAAALFSRPVVPSYAKGFAGFKSGPHALRIDRDSGRQLLDVDHSRN
jgi:hypothetical protein